MNLDELRACCLLLKGVTESIKWDHHLCFSVGDKMFLITSPDEVPVNASFKTNDELFETLSARKGFKPAPYLARNKWIKVDDIGHFSSSEWKNIIDVAYTLVLSKLTKKLQQEILGKKKVKAKSR